VSVLYLSEQSGLVGIFDRVFFFFF